MSFRAIRRVVLSAAALVAARAFGSTDLRAQSVATADAAAFIGNWAIDLEGPQPFTMHVNVTDNAGKVAAEVGSIMGGDPVEVESIAKSGDNLVLSYEADFQGQSIPVAITLAPADGNVRASVDFADGQFTVSGTGEKE